METDKILKHYLEFASGMFANFTGYTFRVSNVVADRATIDFYDSPLYIDFVAEVSFQDQASVECQIMRAFLHRCEV